MNPFRWTFNPAVLTKISGPLAPLSPTNFAVSFPGTDGSIYFSVGDLVQICSDIERMKARIEFKLNRL